MDTDRTEIPDEPPLPRYEQIKQAIRNYIHEQGLKPGDKVPTEAEWCRRFGWSRLTVSRAMNDLALVGVLTRVQGSGTYVAQPGQDRPVRVLISDVSLRPESDYTGPILSGICEAAGQAGVDIAYYHDGAIPGPAEAKNSKADGVLLLAPNLEDIPSILQLQSAGTPVVAMALRSRIGALATVCTDNFGGMQEAVRHLIQLGHRRIALATPGLTSSDVQERINGFSEACFEGGVAFDPAYRLLFDKPIGNAVLEAWFDSLPRRPTAIVCSYGLVFPLMHLAGSRGIRIPQDLSLVATHDSALFGTCVPTITVIRQPLKEMGRRGLAKLVRMLRDQDAGETDVVPMELVVRGSTAACGEQ